MRRNIVLVRCGLAVFLTPLATAGDCLPVETDKLVGPTTEGNDMLGTDVALEGDVAVSGAIGEEEGVPGGGGAQVWERSGDTWLPTETLLASDGTANANFGRSIAIEGDTIAIAAPFDGVPGSIFGAVYIFQNVAGVWTEVQKLTSPDPNTSDEFGYWVDLSGDRLVTGARRDDQAANNAGAVYTFERFGGAWVFDTKLLPPGLAGGDDLGTSVAIDGGTVVAGAPGNDEGEESVGALHVWVHDGGGWVYQQKLLASDDDLGDRLGWSVDIDGDRIVGGAPFDDGLIQDAGAVYAFTRSAGVWSEEQKLTADEEPADAFGDMFGQSVSLDGDNLLVGADLESNAGQGQTGGAFLLTRVGGLWVEQSRIKASDPQPFAGFGWRVALDGGDAVIGAPADSEAGSLSGAIYIYDVSSCVAAPSVTGDLDGDGDVDSTDLNMLLANFGCTPPPNCPGDIDGDGDTDSADLNLLLLNFGT